MCWWTIGVIAEMKMYFIFLRERKLILPTMSADSPQKDLDDKNEASVDKWKWGGHEMT